MTSSGFNAAGLVFVPNNFAAPLNTDSTPEAFHSIQRFLSQSVIGRALVEPAVLSGSQIAAFWSTGDYDTGHRAHGLPSIVFTCEEEEYMVTTKTIRRALGFPRRQQYDVAVSDDHLRAMLTEIGYAGSTLKLGQLKRPLLRKEWSFFFDCITRAFSKKQTNWDDIPLDTLQIGYSILYPNIHFDYGRLVFHNIAERMQEDPSTVYFSRFCQILINARVPEREIPQDDRIDQFQVAKRVFSDLTNKDARKGNVGDFQMPQTLRLFLEVPVPIYQQQPEPQAAQPQYPEQEAPQVNSDVSPSIAAATSSRAPKKKSCSGTMKKTGHGGSLKRLKTNAPRSSDNMSTGIPEVHIAEPTQKRRRLVAEYDYEEVENVAPNSDNVRPSNSEAVPTQNADLNEARVNAEQIAKDADTVADSDLADEPIQDSILSDFEAPQDNFVGGKGVEENLNTDTIPSATSSQRIVFKRRHSNRPSISDADDYVSTNSGDDETTHILKEIADDIVQIVHADAQIQIIQEIEDDIVKIVQEAATAAEDKLEEANVTEFDLLVKLAEAATIIS